MAIRRDSSRRYNVEALHRVASAVQEPYQLSEIFFAWKTHPPDGPLVSCFFFFMILGIFAILVGPKICKITCYGCKTNVSAMGCHFFTQRSFGVLKIQCFHGCKKSWEGRNARIDDSINLFLPPPLQIELTISNFLTHLQ